MRKWGSWAVAAAVLASSAGIAVPRADAVLPAPLAPIDAVLQQTLASTTGTVRAVVRLDAVATPLQLTALRALGIDATPYSVLPMIAIQGPAIVMNAVARLPFVRAIWGNHPLEETLEQSTEMIQADPVYAAPMSVDGDGVRIAILDSGIDATHPDLALGTKTVENVKLLGYTKLFRDHVIALPGLANTDTTTGHGTHVAGIAAGTGGLSGGAYAGVAPGADLVGIGAADGLEMLTALGGYDWILAHRDELDIRVINNSWADGTIAYDPNDPLNVASRMAHDAGITVVFAAGNDGQTGGNVYNRYAWPEWVVGVGGLDKLGRLGDYSSRGDATHHADVVAPGSFIVSTRAQTGVVSFPNQLPIDATDPLNPRIVPLPLWPYYTGMVGTSMAAPHVAGVVALLLDADPTLTPDEIKDVLVRTATPVPGCDPIDCGAGLVNALAAVTDASNDAPVGVLTASVVAGLAPLDVVLDASASTDDGAVAGFRWDVDGDGAVDAETTTPSIDHTFTAGVWHPTLTVVDDDGVTGAPVTIEVRSSNPPDAQVSVPARANGGRPVTFDASASSDPDGTIVEYRFVFGDGSEVVSTEPVVTHTYTPSRTRTYAWYVVVTDDAGVTASASGTTRIKK
jgi:serine protease AprX